METMPTQSPRRLAKYLAGYMTDKSTVRVNVAREFSKPYTQRDIDRMLEGGTDSTPRKVRNVGEPIAWDKQLQTTVGGSDPLAKALLQWGANNNGLPGMTRAMCDERLAA